LFRECFVYLGIKEIKKVMKNNIQKTIEKVSNSFPSIFTREDVIKLLTDLSAEMQDEAPKQVIDKDVLLTSFRQMLSEKDWDNAADKDDVDFSIGYDNKLEVDRIAIDEDFIIGSAVDALEALWDVLEEAAEQE
jgi:hypothetical protein